MFCQACNSDSGPSLFCNVCDIYLPTQGCGVKAGVARRLAAFCVDLFVAGGFIALAILSIRGFLSGDDARARITASCWALAGLLYLVGFFKGLSVGQTLGKAICNLRVVDKRNGSIPGIGRRLLRETLGKWVSGLFLSIGYFWAIWDRDGQTWHDKIAGTVVLHEEQMVQGIRPEPAKWWAFAEILAFIVLVVPIILPLELGQPQPSGPSVEASTGPAPYAAVPATPFAASNDQTPVAPADDADTATAQSEGSRGDDQGVATTISGWASAQARNDPTTTASYYAEQVDRYFLQRNVTREFVQQDKQAFVDSGKRLQNFTVGDLQYEDTSPEAVTVRLTKNWVVVDPGGTSAQQGSTHSRLWLGYSPDGWKITGEQDLK